MATDKQAVFPACSDESPAPNTIPACPSRAPRSGRHLLTQYVLSPAHYEVSYLPLLPDRSKLRLIRAGGEYLNSESSLTQILGSSSPFNSRQNVEAFHWVRMSASKIDFRVMQTADSHTSGLAWHTEEYTLRQKFEEFGVVDEAVSAFSIRFLCSRLATHRTPSRKT